MNKLIFIDSSEKATENEKILLREIIGKEQFDNLNIIYKDYNGGQPQPSFVHDEKNLYPINSFFTIAEILSNYEFFEDFSSPNGFNKYEMLPFAYDPGSGIYAISLKQNTFGMVYFYVLHEEAEVFGIWDNFKSFLDCIVEDPDD